MTQIVITGIGACTSVGDCAESCFNSFLEGRMGNKPLVHLDASKFNSQIAYDREETNENNGKFRSSGFVGRSIKEALDQAGLSKDIDIPVYIGTGLRELRTAEISALNNETISVEDLDFTATIKKILPNSQRIYTLSNACAASNYALALACDALTIGSSEIAIAAGCDTLTASMFGLLDRVNPTKPSAIQVFDKMREGVLMGDGGVAIIVETIDSALKNGRTPLATVKGIGLSTDAVHETAPDLDGIIRAHSDAYRRANIAPKDVGLVYVHGTGTQLNDATESEALSKIFSEVVDKPAISGLKSMTGHTSGASGGIGVASAVLSLNYQVIPPTPGTTEVVDAAKGFPIYSNATTVDLNLVQVNAFGFGGVNSVVIIERCEGVS